MRRASGRQSEKGGYYFTIYAPRQTGKTWLMLQCQKEIEKGHADQFAIGSMSMQGIDLGTDDSPADFLKKLPLLFYESFQVEIELPLKNFYGFKTLFLKNRGVFEKPLILFIDEFDRLPRHVIDRQAVFEFKSFTDRAALEESKEQAAGYAKKLNLESIALVVFTPVEDGLTGSIPTCPPGTSSPSAQIGIFPTTAPCRIPMKSRHPLKFLRKFQREKIRINRRLLLPLTSLDACAIQPFSKAFGQGPVSFQRKSGAS